MGGYTELKAWDVNGMNPVLSVWQQVEYKTLLNNQLDSISGNTYTVTLDGLFAVNDILTYIPKTTSLSFVNTDSTLTKAISYDNETGEITYGGLDIPIIIQESSSNVGGQFIIIKCINIYTTSW
jgi:homospermidine synthase